MRQLLAWFVEPIWRRTRSAVAFSCGQRGRSFCAGTYMDGSLVLLALLAMNHGHTLPLDNVLVLRPAKVEDRKAFEALPSIAVISEEPQHGLLKIAQQATAATPDV